MIVMAFLQNMWLRDPQSAQRMIARDTTGRLRGMIIRRALFAGCKTGRVLMAQLGKHWCNHIIWEEASPVITDNPKACPEADPAHVAGALDKHKPDVVVCFSRHAYPAVFHACHTRGIKCISSRHPAARQTDTPERIREVRQQLDRLVILAGKPVDDHNLA